MKKPYPWHELSEIPCDVKGCRRRIKKSVALRIRRRPLVCYEHWSRLERARRTRPAGT